jgi:hypothetical protein
LLSCSSRGSVVLNRKNALLLVFVVLWYAWQHVQQRSRVRLGLVLGATWCYSRRMNVGSGYKYFLSRRIPSIMIRPLSLSLTPLLPFDILLTRKLVVMLRVMLRRLTRPIYRPRPSLCSTGPRLHWQRGGEVFWCSGRHCFVWSCETSPVLGVRLVRSVRGEFGGCDVAWGFGGAGIGVYESEWGAGVVGWCRGERRMMVGVLLP